MSPLTRITSIAAPLPEDNVDTDIILPARFLLLTEKTGLGRYAFYERRQKGDFVLDRQDLPVRNLVAGANFGCGSSREHAPWALADLGVRAIIAPSFGEIFAGNCIKNGMLPLVLRDIAPFMADAWAHRALTIDLERQIVERSGGERIAFSIDGWARQALLNGWDEVDTILSHHGKAIHAFEAEQRAVHPWLWSED